MKKTRTVDESGGTGTGRNEESIASAFVNVK